MIGYRKNTVKRFLDGDNVHGHAEIATALTKWLNDWEVGTRMPKSKNPPVKNPGNCDYWETRKSSGAYNIDASTWQICRWR